MTNACGTIESGSGKCGIGRRAYRPLITAVLCLAASFAPERAAVSANSTAVDSNAILQPAGRISETSPSIPGPRLVSEFGSIELSWLAPGDDGLIGTADRYIVKYASFPINLANWDSATEAPDPPAPLPSGTPQTFTIGGLEKGRPYYVAMRVADDCHNLSALSDVILVTASGLAVPQPVRTDIDTINGTAAAVARVISASLPVYYEFELDTIFLFDNPVLQIGMVADTVVSSTFGNLRSGLTYFWRCRAVASDHSDTSYWSYFSMFEMQIHDGISPTVTVGSPNGGESLAIGSIHVITWTDSDNVGITSHRIEYSTNAGSTWIVIRDWTAGDPHNYLWTVPNVSTTRARIRIFCRDDAGNIGNDVSNANFTIRQSGSLIDERYAEIPERYSLAPAYPNPFNSAAVIYFGLPESGPATVEIFDGSGRKVATIAEGYFAAGWHKAVFDAAALASGVYFSRIAAGSFNETRKLVLVK